MAGRLARGAGSVLSCIIIDDEPLAHEVLKHHLQHQHDVQLLAQCYHATEALHFLASHKVDLLLLDINMPALNGIELLKVLGNRPQVILISAFQQYALEGFELDVADYLLKPVAAGRLAVALDKVRRRLGQNPEALNQHIVLKVDRQQRRFACRNISVLQAYGNYVKLWQGGQMVLVSCTLKQLLQQLPAGQFVQVHKSYIVNKQHVQSADNEHIQLSGGQLVRVGKSFKHTLAELWQA